MFVLNSLYQVRITKKLTSDVQIELDMTITSINPRHRLDKMFKLILTALLVTANASTGNKPVRETTVDVFEGTLQGFFGSSQFPALKSCANETVDAYDQIADAFKKLHTGDESGDTMI